LLSGHILKGFFASPFPLSPVLNTEKNSEKYHHAKRDDKSWLQTFVKERLQFFSAETSDPRHKGAEKGQSAESGHKDKGKHSCLIFIFVSSHTQRSLPLASEKKHICLARKSYGAYAPSIFWQGTTF
jgi:hypothetical protein